MTRDELYDDFYGISAVLGKDEMLNQIFVYMENDALEEMLSYIARVNDIEIEE